MKIRSKRVKREASANKACKMLKDIEKVESSGVAT